MIVWEIKLDQHTLVLIFVCPEMIDGKINPWRMKIKNRCIVYFALDWSLKRFSGGMQLYTEKKLLLFFIYISNLKISSAFMRIHCLPAAICACVCVMTPDVLLCVQPFLWLVFIYFNTECEAFWQLVQILQVFVAPLVACSVVHCRVLGQNIP